jgi:hypothetical protein
MLDFAVKTLKSAVEPDELICRDAVTLDRKSLKTTKCNFLVNVLE